jgi:ATP-dependent Clp protease ATP-binding subunit ClpC
MPDHLTQRTRRIMMLANDIALRHGLDGISDLVLLIAMIEEGGGVAATILQAFDVELGVLYQHLPKQQTDLHVLDLARPSAVSAECQRVLQMADGVAAEYGATQVGTEHLLIGMVRNPETLAAALLAERGVTEDTICQTASKYA